MSTVNGGEQQRGGRAALTRVDRMLYREAIWGVVPSPSPLPLGRQESTSRELNVIFLVVETLAVCWKIT